MANEKTRTQLIDEENIKEQLGPPHPMRFLAKYRRQKKGPGAKGGYDDENLLGKEIKRGSRIIVNQMKRGSCGAADVEGYMLCAVLDAERIGVFWDVNTVFIVEVLKVSSKRLEEHIGRLHYVKVRSYDWFNGCNVVAVGKAYWDKYVPSGGEIKNG